jgi:hypothetical protein
VFSLQFWRRTLAVARAPRVQIAIFGNSDARLMFDLFTKPHSRFPLIKRKTFGVSLLYLPATFQEYLKNHKGARRYRNKCLNAGYKFRHVNAMDHFEDMLTINRSANIRQGVPMSKDYLDPDLVRSYCERVKALDGIVRSDGTLAAYHHTLLLGDVYTGSRVLGHAEDQKFGTMYLLMTELVHTFIELRNQKGYPHWASYDTTWGASEGMLQFKSKLGYAPYNVKWVWKENTSAS